MLSGDAWRGVLHITALLTHVARMCLHAREWPATLRLQVGRQVLFTGFDGMGLTALLGFLVGVSVVTQTQLWLARFGQSDVLGSVLVAVLLREAGPLLVNLVVIGRSGTAVATELAGMTVRGEVRLLEALGLDAMGYLVLPRVVGMALSVFCLAVCLVTVSLVSGYVFGLVMGVASANPADFFVSVLEAVSPTDLLNFTIKTFIAGAIVAAISCVEGLSVGPAVTEVPQAATRAVVKAITAILVVSAVVSVFTYV